MKIQEIEASGSRNRRVRVLTRPYPNWAGGTKYRLHGDLCYDSAIAKEGFYLCLIHTDRSLFLG